MTMKAFANFKHDLNKLSAFYKATIYSYEQTEALLRFRNRNKIKYDEPTETGLLIKQPHYYKIKGSAKKSIRDNLTELIFVRLVSSLEVFLIDLVRDAFLENKEPFKKQEVSSQFTQAELLSLRSTAGLYHKIITKECRRLSSGGFEDIVKFYKKYFNIDLGSFAPGLTKMDEYHDRRHILVHRLGKTDQQFREKYNTALHRVSVDETYLLQCIQDFGSYSEMVTNQLIYQLNNEYAPKKKTKIAERKLKLSLQLLNNDAENIIQPNFEFWVDDEYLMLNDILDEKRAFDDNKYELVISGKHRQIKSYMKFVRKSEKKKELMVRIIIDKLDTAAPSHERKILDLELLNEIKLALPPQPWPTGAHKAVAIKFNISNSLVSLAIQQLIARGDFKPQINGVLIEPEGNKGE